MTVELALVISVTSVVFAIYAGIVNLKRNDKTDAKNEASQLTTVIVKLESIGTGIARIESEVTNVKTDVKEDHERLVRVEESAKQAHKRINECKQQCKILNANAERYISEPDE